MAETSGTVRRGLRLFALRSGPLTRRSDRALVLARLVLLTFLLASIPLAVALSTATYERVHAQETAAARSVHPTTATLVVDAVVPNDPPGAAKSAPQSVVTWTTSGARRQAVVVVPYGARAGSTVRLWIDQHGTVSTQSPSRQSEAAGLAIGVGLLTIVGSSMLAALQFLLFQSVLHRRRLREWEAGWAAVEPVWSRKVR